jgi:hypothetical protein
VGETPTVSGDSQTVTFLFTDIESSLVLIGDGVDVAEADS